MRPGAHTRQFTTGGRMRILRLLATMCVVVVSGLTMFATPAAAQATGVVAAGISFVHEGRVKQTAPGVAIDGAINFPTTRRLVLGAVGDVGVNKFDGCTEKSFAG